MSGKAWQRVIRILKLMGAATLVCATGAQAQGTRKDDIVFGPPGGPTAGATVAICAQPATTSTTPCSPLASIFTDSALTQPLSQPFKTDGLGNYHFYASPGKYTIQIYGPGLNSTVLPDVILPSDPMNPAVSTVTTSGAVSAFTLTLGGNLTVGGNASVTGSLTASNIPANIAGAAYTNDAVLYASPNGNDTFSGTSSGFAKQTLYAAIQVCMALPQPPVFGCTIYYNEGTAYGGPVANQGMWLMGSPDPNYNSNTPTGWIKKTRALTIVGMSTMHSAANSPGLTQAFLASGSPTDTSKPAIWLSGTGVTLYNVNVGSPAVCAKLAIDSNGLNTTNVSANNQRWFNFACSANNSSAGYGPGIAIGSNLLWWWCDHCDIAGNSAAAVGSDNRAAILDDPGATGTNNGLIYITNSIFNNGSGYKKYVNNTGASSATLDTITQEASAATCAPIYWQLQHSAGAIPDTEVNLRGSLVTSDCSAGSMNTVENDLTGSDPGWIRVGFVSPSPGTIDVNGPAVRVYPAVNESAMPSTIEANGQFGLVTKHLYHQQAVIAAQQDSSRRAFAPTAVRFTNLAPQAPSAWASFSGGATVTTGIAAPDGTSNVVQLSSASGSQFRQISASGQTWAPGDWLIAGCWAQAASAANGFAHASGSGATLELSGTGTFTFQNGNTTLGMNSAYKGSGGWEWFVTGDKLAIGSGAGNEVINAWVDTSRPMNFYGCVLLHIPAGTITDDEAFYMLEHLQSYPDTATPGDVAMLRGQRFSFGVPGSNFFGKFLGSFSADRQFTWPDVSMNIAGASGTLTNGHCAQFNAGGLIVDSGAACGGGGGAGINVNGSALAGTTGNFSNSTPAAPANSLNVIWAKDTGSPSTNISASLPIFVASGTSHAIGLVPDPGSTAGSTRFLREDATWATPPGGVTQTTFIFSQPASAQNAPSSANAIMVSHFNLDTSLTFSKIYFDIGTADTAAGSLCGAFADCYDIGLYDSGGNLKCNIGATAFSGTGLTSKACAQGSVTLSAGTYIFAFTGNAATAKIFYGSANCLNILSTNTSTTTSTNGALPGSISVPAFSGNSLTSFGCPFGGLH